MSRYLQYLRKNPLDTFIAITTVIFLIEFILLKYFYPFPNFTNDSYFYLTTAIDKENTGIWPIGYSIFLRLVGAISRSDYFLIFVQLLVYSLSASYFHHTITTSLSFSKILNFLFYCTLFINPAVIYLNNYILSDGLFVSISLIWFAQLLSLVKRDKFNILYFVLHSIILVVAISLRHQALFYPLISIGCLIGKSEWKFIEKTSGISIISIVLGVFTFLTMTQNENTFGVRQFSIFSGWQIANNALIGVMHHVPTDTTFDEVPPKFKVLHEYVKRYNSIYQPINTLSGVYIWNYEYSPLARYAEDNNNININDVGLYKWIGLGMANVEQKYQEYGISLIKKYPIPFFKYYILLNSLQYLYPRVECMSKYNMDQSTVNFPAIQWFRYENENIYSYTNGKELIIFNSFGVLFIISIALLIILLTYWFLKIRIRNKPSTTLRFIWLANYYLIVSFIFSVIAAPVVLRYQAFNQILLISFNLIIIQLIINHKKEHNDLYLKRSP
jgi:hypothetical protein